MGATNNPRGPRPKPEEDEASPNTPTTTTTTTTTPNTTTTTATTNTLPPPVPQKHHHQATADPLAHFLAIPWTARLLTDPAAFGIVVSDRRPLASGDKQFVRSVLSSATTVRACVTFFLRLPPQGAEKKGVVPVSKSRALLQGGGPRDGEDPERPFLLFNALLDLGEDLCGHKGTMHGGALGVLLDETMCAAADNQTQYAFTATMHTSFLRPVRLPGPVIVRSRVVRRERRKIYVRGTIEDSEGNIMTESEAMVVDKTPNKSAKL
ncbi:HotDog domain-containing protein [Chaetomium tenue]|uniref:HotDog domain-containing protein n=1 Tax=Chaetomium tenue TaxID=1854479 RepID=A0ACB7P8R5_9PEZI|nr:HotDog domain-containing protein [Chaetomium globosum]